jgi:hypothetical protein
MSVWLEAREPALGHKHQHTAQQPALSVGMSVGGESGRIVTTVPVAPISLSQIPTSPHRIRTYMTMNVFHLLRKFPHAHTRFFETVNGSRTGV